MKQKEIKMFKKSLLALALTGVVGSASAATLVIQNDKAADNTFADVTAAVKAGTANIISQEGLTKAKSFAFAPKAGTGAVEVAPLYTLTGPASLGDFLVAEVSGAAFDTTLTTPTITLTGTLVASFTTYSADKTQAFFTVTTAGVATDTVTFDTLKFAATGFGAAPTLSVYFRDDSNVLPDYQKVSSVRFANVKNEFGSQKVNVKLDGVIDVNNERKIYTDAAKITAATSGAAADVDDTVTTDRLVLNMTPVATDIATVSADSDSLTVKVYGDFNRLDLNGDKDVADANEGSVAINAANCAATAYAADLMSVTFTSCDLPGTDLIVTETIPAKVNQVSTLASTDYGVDVKFTHSTGTAVQVVTATSADGSAGSNTINGSTTNVDFLPYGENFAQSVTISNTSSTAADITVDVIQGGVTKTLTVVAKAAAKSVTNISAELKTFMAAEGITGDVALSIFVNAPTGVIGVKALYFAKSDADRVLTK